MNVLQLVALIVGSTLLTLLAGLAIALGAREIGLGVMLKGVVVPTIGVVSVCVASAFLISYGSEGFK